MTIAGSAPHKSGLISILVPVYNERPYLRKCIERVMAAPLPDGLEREIIIVDDGSTDGSAALVDQLAERHTGVIRAFHNQGNQGKGASIRRAVSEMRGQYAVFQDADLEYDPEDYKKLLRPLLQGYADVVYGSRFSSSEMRRVLNYHHALGNLLLTHFSNMFTGLNLTDMETCYKAFRADILRTIPIRSMRFGIEPEITAKVAKRYCVVYEVPISYHGRTYYEGKKITWKDGVSTLYTIVKYWLIDDCFEQRYGHQILQSLSQARRFTDWTVDVIHPFFGQHILEVGSGIGNISRLLLKGESLTLTDVDPVYLEFLENTYRDNDMVSVKKLDITKDSELQALRDNGNLYDTVVCLNVLEHIEDDLAALKRIRGILSPGGRLILQVPQYQGLYGTYDKELGHFRRYGKKQLAQLAEQAGFEIKAMMSFNPLGLIGWWMNSKLMGSKDMSKWQIKVYDTMVPLQRLVHKVLPVPGLSLICVAQAD